MNSVSADIKIEVFTGDDLFKRETEVLPIVESYLWERDVIMLLGSEKAGKSINALQMGMSISTGGYFLGKYKCTKRPVVYLQTEGKKDETAMRMERMAKGIGIDKNNFFRVYKKFMPLNIPSYLQALDKSFSELPIQNGVLIVDCLYMAMSGDLNDNKDVRNFIAALSILLEKYKLTCIIVHHAKKEEFFEGKKLKMGDKVSYGSVFLRANVDHIIYLDMDGSDKSRVLSCDTQRSGLVAEKEELILIQPDPLFFQIRGDLSASEESIYFHLKKGNLSKEQIIKVTCLSESTVERSLKSLVFSSRANIVDESKSEHGKPTKIYGVLNKTPNP